MKFSFELRLLDTPYVERLWRTTSEEAGRFMSVAGTRWQMVVAKQQGKTLLTIHGPETKARMADCPENTEFFGLDFKLGVFMPSLPTSELADFELHLPEETQNRFWFRGTSWQFPDFENADIFVDHLVRDELLAFDPIVNATLQCQSQELSLRSVQRRFLRATGLTHGAFCQIERAQQAVTLLEQGVSILDTVDRVGYADQSHLTRSLKRFVGRTPGEILRNYWAE